MMNLTDIQTAADHILETYDHEILSPQRIYDIIWDAFPEEGPMTRLRLRKRVEEGVKN